MTFVFPADKVDFLAPNGVTYHWDGVKWVTKAFKADESALEPIVERLDEGEAKQGELTKRVNDGEIKQSQIELSLEELSITKGSVARYQVKDTTLGIGTRNGELYLNTGVPEDVTYLSFAPFDLNGTPTKPALTGDIVELVEGSGAFTTGEVSRYRITSGGDAQALTVEFLSGTNVFEVDEILEVYIYPQNDETASKEYVDSQDALLQGQINDKADKDDVDSSLANKVNKDGDTFTNYLDFEAQGGGARFFRGSDKYFSVWSFQVNETRCRIDPGRDFKLTGYKDGDTTEQQLLWWDQANDAFHISRVADPTRDDHGISRGYANKSYLKLSGGTLSGELKLNGGDDTDNLSIYANKSNDDSAITALNNSTLRLRTSPSGDHGDSSKRTHLTMGVDGTTGAPITNIYHLSEPVQDDQPATKAYVDANAGGGGGVPVGSIMIWLHSTPPDGWFKLQGKTFAVADYPLLHAYLQQTNGYVSGVLPDWEGRYPGEYGDHLAEASPALGKKVGQKTAKPSGGAPKSTSNTVPTGATRTFNATGNTNAYSAGQGRVTVGEGWDDVTRPPTVIVHYIIKHD